MVKQFGKAFLTRFTLALIFIGIPFVDLMDYYQSEATQVAITNKEVAAKNKQEISQEQAQVNAFETAISNQINLVKNNVSLWEKQLRENDPTVDMSYQQIHDLTFSYNLPIVSQDTASLENEGTYSIALEQEACIDLIDKFNQLKLPQEISSNHYDIGMCNGR